MTKLGCANMQKKKAHHSIMVDSEIYWEAGTERREKTMLTVVVVDE